jgi:transcriptional regulator with XRE-family HTH domain
MVNAPPPTISSAQLRAARAWLNWSQEELAKEAGVSKGAVNRFEQGTSLPHPVTLERLRKALETAGIEFQFRKMIGTGISSAMPREPRPREPSSEA